MTRRGFIGGLGTAALTGAGLTLGLGLKNANALPAPDAWDREVDVVVAGTGLAGLCAAIEAASGGAKTLLLDAFAVVGGNTALSTGWFNAANSPIQQKLGIKDSVEEFYKDSMQISEDRRDPDLTKVVAEQSSEAIQWLMDQGVNFRDVAEPAMGSPKPRAIQAEGYGKKVVETLSSVGKQKGVEIVTRARVLSLYRKMENGANRVVGAEADMNGKKVRIGARAVVIATGGFMHNKKLVDRFLPQWSKSLVIGTPANVGDGLIMADVEGADAVNLDRALVTPTLEVKTKTYLTSGALSGGAILVNENGKRFTNELQGYTEVSMEMLEQEKVYEIMVEEVHPKVKEFIDKGIVKRADNAEELAQKIGADPATLKQTIESFNQATESKTKDSFGRTVFREKLEPPFYFMQVLPVLLLTLGGLKIGTDARVLDMRDNAVLQGLYSAGEVTGGYIDYGYRTGDSLMFCTVLGKIAGKNAAEETKA